MKPLALILLLCCCGCSYTDGKSYGDGGVGKAIVDGIFGTGKVPLSPAEAAALAASDGKGWYRHSETTSWGIGDAPASSTLEVQSSVRETGWKPSVYTPPPPGGE